MWYPRDPIDLRWARRDGAAALVGCITLHLIREQWWRETGEWLGPEAPHAVQPEASAKDRRVTTIPARTPIPTMTVAPAHTLIPRDRPRRRRSRHPRRHRAAGSAAPLIGTLLSATILAALIAAAVNIMLARRKSREEERARLRDRFAQAYGCVRRVLRVRLRHPAPPPRRSVGRSEYASAKSCAKIQADLSAHEAWVKLESGTVGNGVHGAHPGNAQDRRRRHATGVDRRTRNQRCWRQYPPEDRRPQPAQAFRDGVHGRCSRAPACTSPMVVEVGACRCPDRRCYGVVLGRGSQVSGSATGHMHIHELAGRRPRPGWPPHETV